MTRFARAEGSKSSNKRTYEEATPWEEMRKDVLKQKKPKKKNKKGINDRDENIVTDNKNDEVESNNEIGIIEGQNSQKIEMDNITNCSVEQTLNMTKVSKKKNKKEKDVDDKDANLNVDKNIDKTNKEKSDTEIYINEDRFSQENEMNITTEQTDNYSNLDDASNKKNKKSKQKNNKDKPEKAKKLSLEERKNNYIEEDGVKYKILKKGKKVPWIDLPYEENDYMTRYRNMYIRKQDISLLENYQKSLEEGDLDNKTIKKKVLRMEGKFHNKLRVELLRAEIAKVPQLSKSYSKQQSNNEFQDEYEPVNLEFKENHLMTLYEGVWIRKGSAKVLDIMRERRRKKTIKIRTDGNKDPSLTPEEDSKLEEFMTKQKRKEHRLLRIQLIHEAKTQLREKSGDSKKKKKKPARYLGINYNADEEIVRVGVFNIKKEAAERLNKLKASLEKEGCTPEELRDTMKAAYRREERILKREKQSYCFRCRRVGHALARCPESALSKDAVELCFKCGSTEHVARRCPSNSSGYQHAECFICHAKGHISRDCPDNPNGLYPDGGCCNECGSVQHLKKDCPEFIARMEDNTLKASRFRPDMEIDAIDEEEPQTTPKSTSKKKKVIKF